MGRLVGWFIAFVAVVATVVGLLYLGQGVAPEAGLVLGALVAIPGATLLVGIDWALSAETVGRRLGRLVLAVLVTLLVSVMPIAFLGVFMLTNSPNPAA